MLSQTGLGELPRKYNFSLLQFLEPSKRVRSGRPPMRISVASSIISILLLAASIPGAVYSFGAESIFDSIKKVSPATACLIFGALLINGLVAAYRFKVASGATGHEVR